jgi:hypothetical protein
VDTLNSGLRPGGAWASVAGVVRMPRQYCKCPIDLLSQDEPGKLVGQGHLPKGEHGLRPARDSGGPSTGWPDRKHNCLLARVPADAEPLGQSFRGEGFSPAIQKNQPRRGTRMLFGDGGE